ITGFVLFVLVAVEGLLVAFVWRYRRRKRSRDADGPQIHGSSRLENMWTLIPVAILVAVAAFVFVKLPGIKNVPSANAAAGRLEVTVTGQRFSWQFNYPNGAVAIDHLRVRSTSPFTSPSRHPTGMSSTRGGSRPWAARSTPSRAASTTRGSRPGSSAPSAGAA